MAAPPSTGRHRTGTSPPAAPPPADNRDAAPAQTPAARSIRRRATGVDQPIRTGQLAPAPGTPPAADRSARPEFPCRPSRACFRAIRRTNQSDTQKSAFKARTQSINALRSVLVTASPELRDQLRALSTTRLVGKAAQLRPGALGSPLAASKLALRQPRPSLPDPRGRDQQPRRPARPAHRGCLPTADRRIRRRRRHGRRAPGRRRR